jgi:DNA-binding GntR family transcriptional regulator
MAPSNQDIYERIYAAISERRLAPGTKLSEERLAVAFHASRSRIREVLLRLSQDRVIDLQANRGAFVASPTPRDLADVFAVRRALERAITVTLAASPDAGALPALHDHLHLEAQARATGDRAALARLTGDFHLRLAELTDNRWFVDGMRRLVAMTSLAIAQTDDGAHDACPDHDHADIVSAIAAGDGRRAERLMRRHLDQVEHGIRPPAADSTEPDFAQIFRLAEPPAPKAAPRAATRQRRPAARGTRIA